MLIDLPVHTDIYDFLNVGIILILTNVHRPSFEMTITWHRNGLYCSTHISKYNGHQTSLKFLFPNIFN